MAVFCLISVTYAVVAREKDVKSTRLIVCVLMTCLLFNVSEAAANLFEGDVSEMGRIIARVSNFLLFFCVYNLMVFEMGYVMRRSEMRGGSAGSSVLFTVLLLWGLGTTGLVLTQFSGIFYSFDEQNRFVWMDFKWLHFLILILTAFMIFMQTIRNYHVLHRSEFLMFLGLSLLPVSSIAFQTIIPWSISLYSIGISLSVLIVFVSFRRESTGTKIARESLKLNAENIDAVSTELRSFMASLEMEKTNQVRVQLIIEETLLRLRDRFGEDDEFDVYVLISLNRPLIRIEKKGELYNPLRKDEDILENMGGNLLSSVGLNPVFSYTAGRNVISFPLNYLRMNPAVKMMNAFIIGLIAGFIGLYRLSPSDLAFLRDSILRPVYEMMSNMLYCVTGPILFVMVIAVILDATRISEQGGSKTYIMARYFSLSTLIGLVAIVPVMLMFVNGLDGNSAAGRSGLSGLLDDILSIIPRDIFTPFVEANTPQLLLMAIVLGFAIVGQGGKVEGLANTIRQLNHVNMQLANWIGRIFPIFSIFLAALICLTDHLWDLVLMIPVLLISVLISVMCMFVAAGYIVLRKDVRLSVLLKKCWPSFLTTFKSGSLDSSYGQSQQCCRQLGMDPQFAEVGLPLGLVMYMPANVVGTVLFTMYAVFRSDVEISPLWMVLSVVMAVILFVATPPIPGANFLAYIVMIYVLGIESDFLMLALIYEIVYGVFASAANQFFVQLDLILQAGKMGLFKEDKLKSL